ncbi:MAG: decarboxylating 6-phosphogluconate dehydrogenase [Desulfohalobiaceae bacterium]|nr:decarboxylating 6-phosphogluconate dehydrogenase [Desulfohalobiaceae bacterium]
MKIGMIGLGRMGLNMARRLLLGGHEVAAFNRTPARTEELSAEGAIPCFSLQELTDALEPPRAIWLMLPAGEVVDSHIESLLDLLQAEDIIIDGGNTYYKDDQRRARTTGRRGIHYLDAGTSGGVWGLEIGYCLMLGGEKEPFDRVEPLLRTLAPPDGYLHCGPSGAGHFVKMIHNGIEYGLMQAYAEGFGILEDSEFGPNLDYAGLSHLWNQGSVIRSWLLELAEGAFAENPRLDEIQGYVEDSGEGRWAVKQAVDTASSAPVLTLSLMERFRSRREDHFPDRFLAALRHRFGGHAVKKK